MSKTEKEMLEQIKNLEKSLREVRITFDGHFSPMIRGASSNLAEAAIQIGIARAKLEGKVR